MDIFTTVLTRVMPTPIKPASLKVKALLKEAATGKLKEDLDHLENHDYYFIPSSTEQGTNKEQHQAQSKDDEQSDNKVSKDEDSVITEGKDHKPHLDIFV